MIWKASLLTILVWFIGLVFDANLGYNETLGFTQFRILFPILSMGGCILSHIKKMKEKPEDSETEESALS